jgi:hypothetical protein
MDGVRTSAAPDWAGPALLVPMSIEALPVTSAAATNASSWSPPNYQELKFMRRADAAPFTPGRPAPPGPSAFRGVILHWSLPDGLTAGHQSGAGVAYPAIPNRWLVTRKRPTAGQWEHEAWIVVSDYRSDGTGAPWPPELGASRIGRAWPAREWPGEAGLNPESLLSGQLTAVGPGDPSFAAFAPNVPNVLSFPDRLGAGTGPVSYCVLGWCADRRHDPLFGAAEFGADGWRTPAQWHELMTRLGWSIGDADELQAAQRAARAWAAARGYPDDGRPHGQLPARTLCYGSLQGVPWEGPDGVVASGVPTQNAQLPSYVRPRVAIAHTGVDALAALVGDSEPDPGRAERLIDILTAFQLDLLPKLTASDAVAQLAAAHQQTWFAPRAGGTSWEIIAAEDAAAPRGASAAPLTGEQQRLLTALNRAQADLDDREQELTSRQWDLYALWWKDRRLNQVPPLAEGLTTLVDRARQSSEAAIRRALDAYAEDRLTRDRAAGQLRTLLGGDRLTAGPGQPFWAPTEPVIMISGVQRGHRHGSDDRFGTDGTLRCRFTGQAITGLAVPVGPASVRVTADDLPLPTWSVPGLPLEAPDVVAEAFLLDVDDAPVIATVAAARGGVADPWSLLRAVRSEQTLIWNPALHRPIDPAAISRQARLTGQAGRGTVPSPIAVTFYRPPWSPLFIDWMFEFFPGSDSQRAALANWELPDSGGRTEPLAELSYRWRPAGPPPLRGGRSVSGRATLTPQITDAIADRLRRLLAEHADAPSVGDNIWALNDTLDYLTDADVLSQATSGFNLLFRERSPQSSLSPPAGLLTPFLDPPGGPVLDPDAAPQPPSPDVPAAQSFRPIRNGHLRLTRLWVVDTFGQVFTVIDDGDAALPRGSRPVLGRDLATVGDPSAAELKPRISQHARISLSLLSATSDDAAVGIDATANPICGWVVASPLDRGLLVYAADGTLEGSLLEAVGRAVWWPAPDRHAPAAGGGAPDAIANAHLRSMVSTLLTGRDSAAALRDLLALINEASWGVEPGTGWDDEDIPLLGGHPLALVRGRLALRPYGRADRDQGWWETASDSTAGFDAVRFSIQLGSTELLDDGLVGYFTDDDYRRIHTAYDIGERDYVTRDRPQVSLDGSAAPLLTLLMDPRTEASVISGILPVLRVGVPAWCTLAALARLAVTVRTGPVLTGPAEIALPLPEARRGRWAWLQHPAADEIAGSGPVTEADAGAELPDHPVTVREGWLQLSPWAGPAVLAYTLTPAALATGTGPGQRSGSLMQIRAYNGAGRPVRCAQLSFTVPVGNGERDLIADADAAVTVSAPSQDWTFTHDGAGVFTARPATPDQLIEAGATLTFGLADLRPSPWPGRVVIEIAEITDQLRTTTGTITKVAPMPASLACTAEPRSLAAGREGQLSITACNATGRAVRCDQIVVSVPTGPGPDSLTESPGQLHATIEAPGGWTMHPDGRTMHPDGAVTFVIDAPAAGLLPPGAIVTLRLDRIAVAAAGTAVVAVRQLAGPDTGSTALPIAKRSDSASGADR